jgi:hypothetical protein
VSDDRCSLTWKAAALQDRRLDDADRASFEEHARRCPDCRAEQKSLAILLAELDDAASTDLLPLTHARRRGTLLARANERFVGSRKSKSAPIVALCVAGVVMTAVAMRFGHDRRAAPDVSREPVDIGVVAPRFEVIANEHAMWRARSEGAIGRVDLADGEATFEVHALTKPQRFLVSLPDGEAEATQARFVIDVGLGRTRGVRVFEGQVVVRRRDEREMTLSAGEDWSRSEAVTADDRSSRRDGPATASSTARAPSPISARSPSAASVSSTSPPPPAAAARLAGVKFDEAIGSFVRGAYAQADLQLRDFAAEFPHDARGEDAAFLSAVARWRLGDPAGARARAEDYLTAYPAGLRRGEAQHIRDAAR